MSFPVQQPSTGNNQTWCMECDATENLVRKGTGMNCAGDWNMICTACDKKEFGGRNFVAAAAAAAIAKGPKCSDCGKAEYVVVSFDRERRNVKKCKECWDRHLN